MGKNEGEEKPRIAVKGGVPTMGIEAFIAAKGLMQASKSRILSHIQTTGGDVHKHRSMKEWEEIVNTINN